jgi:23S rRNA (cytidine1920-2'-O)/16S rRNA (cytidine1409-2'-O)-methyltransferase
MARRRADLLAVEQGLAPSRSRAQALILSGAVLFGEGERVDKAGQLVDERYDLYLRDQPLPYVSRGGLKLEAALDQFGIDPQDRVCLDVGASTGGFTDCLLQHGAARVYAVDVGYGQLAWSLRQNPRVVVIERCNIRTMDAALLPEICEVIVVDVSFISLRLVLPAVARFAAPSAALVALVKPQFEVGRDRVGKGGIVRDPAARADALSGVVQALGGLQGSAIRSMESPIRGAKGNVEYLVTGSFPE